MKEEKLFLGGAVIAAVAASFCCVEPLTFALLGLGVVGASTFFEPFRPYFLGLAILALAYSLYRVYFRRGKCAPNEMCETKPASKASQAFLWIAAVAILAIALSPYYAGKVIVALSNSQKPIAEVASAITTTESEANKTVVIEVEGMTCEGCATQINETLRKMKGIISAEASYPNKNVRVVYVDKQITLDEIKQAINALGYKAK